MYGHFGDDSEGKPRLHSAWGTGYVGFWGGVLYGGPGQGIATLKNLQITRQYIR